jgi:glycosyltransferase involved in cell wall biosynthesis
MEVKLVPDLPAYGSLSMARYHQELRAALLQVAEGGEDIADVKLPGHTYAYTGMKNSFCKRWLLRFDRWLTYPTLLRSYHPDLFHVLDQSYSQLVFAAPKVRTIVTCHDLIPLRNLRGDFSLDYGSFATKAYLRIMEGLKRAAHIIAVSEATRDDLENLLGIERQKITVVYSGINSAFEGNTASLSTSKKQALRNSLSLPTTGKMILHVGSNAPYKNVMTIIKALPKVQFGEEVWFVMVGSSERQEERREASNLGVADRVISVRGINQDQTLAQYYRASDVFVFPSIWEGFGWPPLEAMSCGTPVITSSVPALREIVGEAAIQVAPENSVLLANAISRVLGDANLRNDLIARGLSRAKQFNWITSARQTLSVYRQLCEEARILNPTLIT